MWEQVGLVRTAPGLASAVRELAALEAASPAGRLRDMALTGRLIAAAALARAESRGGHYRADAPEPRDQWRRRSFVRLDDDGSVVVLDQAPSIASRRPRPTRAARGTAA
jgi:L-aspartate oxidase